MGKPRHHRRPPLNGEELRRENVKDENSALSGKCGKNDRFLCLLCVTESCIKYLGPGDLPSHLRRNHPYAETSEGNFMKITYRECKILKKKSDYCIFDFAKKFSQHKIPLTKVEMVKMLNHCKEHYTFISRNDEAMKTALSATDEVVKPQNKVNCDKCQKGYQKGYNGKIKSFRYKCLMCNRARFYERTILNHLGLQHNIHTSFEEAIFTHTIEFDARHSNRVDTELANKYLKDFKDKRANYDQQETNYGQQETKFLPQLMNYDHQGTSYGCDQRETNYDQQEIDHSQQEMNYGQQEISDDDSDEEILEF